MTFLGIDTSTPILDCAIVKDGTVLAAASLENERTHSEFALPMVKEIVDQAAIKLEEIDFFVCGNGPGSYTGLRIGAAIVQALAFATGKEARGINTLRLMALAAQGGENELIAPIIHARNNAVFAAVYKGEEEIFMPQRIDFDELKAKFPLAKFIEPTANKWKFAKGFEEINIAYLGQKYN